jgi:hypothetical protein
MGYINQASATVTDSPLITISMWVNLASASGGVSILEFGHSYGDDNFAGSYIWVGNGPDLPMGNWIDVNFQSAFNSLTDNTSYLTTTDEAHDTLWADLTDPLSTFTAYFDGSVINIGSPVAPGNWFHLFIAADFTNTTSLGGATNTAFIFLNGVRQNWSNGLDGGNLKGRIVDQATGQVQPGMLAYFDGAPNSEGSVYADGPFSLTRPVTGADGDVTIAGIVPGFSIGLNGTEIGIPAQAAHAASGVVGNSDTAIRYADVQIWVGQYIDPTTNIDKFISGARPVNPAIAEAAFGAPDFRFSGPALDIGTNSGTGGDFTKTGTVTDAAPGP